MPPDAAAPKPRRPRRQLPGGVTLEELNAHIDVRVMHALQAHEERMGARMDRRFDELADLLRSGFPEGDPAAHRRVHEARMNKARDWARMTQGIAQTVVAAVFLAALGFLGMAAYQHILTIAHRDMPALHPQRTTDEQRREDHR